MHVSARRTRWPHPGLPPGRDSIGRLVPKRCPPRNVTLQRRLGESRRHHSPGHPCFECPQGGLGGSDADTGGWVNPCGPTWPLVYRARGQNCDGCAGCPSAVLCVNKHHRNANILPPPRPQTLRSDSMTDSCEPVDQQLRAWVHACGPPVSFCFGPLPLLLRPRQARPRVRYRRDRRCLLFLLDNQALLRLGAPAANPGPIPPPALPGGRRSSRILPTVTVVMPAPRDRPTTKAVNHRTGTPTTRPPLLPAALLEEQAIYIHPLLQDSSSHLSPRRPVRWVPQPVNCRSDRQRRQSMHRFPP